LRLDQEEDSQPLITIELNTGAIRQKKGKKNRSCSPDEDYIIRIWAKENKIKFL
jgi:hypothetical protein